MRNKGAQSGFTLIELIAVMVILGILAAVIVPRIATLTSGAYESNVRSMFGVIKNEVNAQALKAAMSGGSTGHLETYPEIKDLTTNFALDEWVEDYETEYWSSFARDKIYTNDNKVDNDHALTSGVLFMYHPHGASGGVLWGGDAAGIDDPGTATSKEDIYWIFYAPITTTGGNTAGRDLDGYILAAFTDKGTMLDFEATFANGAVTEGAEAEIADIQWITP